MRTVFADACYWIAIINRNDQLHKKALDATSSLGNIRIVTSEMVLTEFLNGLGNCGQNIREQAIKATRTILKDPNVEVVPQSSQQFHSALERYESRQDKQWGLTDCSSMKIWKRNTFRKC